MAKRIDKVLHLHVAIQDAMGWLDYHLHAFRVASPSHGQEELIGIPVEDLVAGVPEYLPGWMVAIDRYFAKPGDSARYEYDFGDGWEHEVVLDKIMPREPKKKYPRCVAGEHACPPEDCGGPPGYENMLKALADPSHAEHDDTVAWIGTSFDPRLFDPAKVRFANPKTRWKKAFGEP
jgi:hypothetical protein